MAVTCIWELKNRTLKLRTFFLFQSDIFYWSRVVPAFFLSCAVHQSIDGKHLFTTTVKMYDTPGQTARSQASVGGITTNAALLTEFRGRKVVLYPLGHCSVGDWNGGG
jgi:hypothetical protein